MTHVLFAPYHLGQRGVQVGGGPLRIREALRHPSAKCIEVGEKAEIAAVNQAISSAVAASVAAGDTPLVVSGNCNSCLGTLAGLDRHDCGIVWFDAHGDFNTPETSLSGLLDGMALNFATRRFIPESKTALIGVRELDPAERILLDNSAVLVSPAGYLPDNSPRLPDVSRIYLHLDIDVLDRAVSPGVNCQAPGGLSTELLFSTLAKLKARYTMAAIALTNYNPEKDEGNRTLDIAIQLIATLI